MTTGASRLEKKKKLKKGDILLLLLYMNNCAPIRGRTRLQKMMFVFQEEIMKQYGFNKKLELKRQENLFDYRAHRFGPFSKDVFELMEFFVNIQMVDVKFDSDYEELLDSMDDEDVLVNDIEDDPDLEDNEIYPEGKGDPIYKLTKIGKGYVEEKLLQYLDEKQKAALEKLKESFNSYSLNQILKYVYTKYPKMTEESEIKNAVLGRVWPY